ncbi:MAG: O-antigen ligase family protein [Pirellulales bacterium]|nr:O-antigen ligase family protein [Pirellulales bacterium]
MTAIYFVAAAVALIWSAIFVLRGSLTAGCLALLVAGACFGHDFLRFEVGPIPMTIDRLVVVLLLLAYAVHRRLGRTAPKPLGKTDVLLFAFLGVLAFSACYGSFGGQGDGIEIVFRLLAGYLIPGVVYWIARQSPLNRSNVSLTQGVLTCLGVYLALTGLLEVSGQWWAVFPRHIADQNVGLHFGRARGPMVHAVSFGLHLGVCLLAAWLWQWRFGRPGRLVIVALVPLLLAGIYVSYTRSVWMGTGLGALIVLALTLRGSWRPLVIGGMVSAALLLVATRMDKLVSFEREYAATYTGKSVEVRGAFAYLSWQMFLDRPLLGVGFGQFPEAKLPYLADRSTEFNLEAVRPYSHHIGFLSVLTETGLVGFVLFLALLGGWVRAGWQVCRNATLPPWARAQGILLLGVLGVYLCQTAFHEMSYTPIDNALVFFLAGLTVGLRAAPATADVPAAETAPARLCHLALSPGMAS